MRLQGKRILMTGATGGIGHHLALLLAAEGAELALVDVDAQRLKTFSHAVAAQGGKAVQIVADFNHPHAVQGVVDAAMQQLGGIDMLINNAGVMDFIAFELQQPERIAQMVQINLTVPMQLTRAVLPGMQARNSGQIVNIGSIFGSLGFPHYASYCATKFAMRGFSQALRRELADTALKVTYIAPRAVKTPLNDEATRQMLAAANIAMDEPQVVAVKILAAILAQRDEVYIGQPESFFAWLNGLLPAIVSRGLRKQTRLARPYAQRTFS
jgi:short-subunit dehydrogenase